jgi:hypothetical protein
MSPADPTSIAEPTQSYWKRLHLQPVGCHPATDAENLARARALRDHLHGCPTAEVVGNGACDDCAEPQASLYRFGRLELCPRCRVRRVSAGRQGR